MSGKPASHRWMTARRTCGDMAAAALLVITVTSGLSAVAAEKVSYEVLHHFVPHPSGAFPNLLIEGSDRILYGTTRSGGAHNHGTIFRLDGEGVPTTLYSYDVPPADGEDEDPPTALIQGSDGSLYGTTGSLSHEAAYPGTVFRLDPDGVFTTLHSFFWGGAHSPTTFIEARDRGFFYGTTAGGSANTQGTIFQLDREGALTILHFFDGADGALPNALIEGSDGNLYGTTRYEGSGLEPTGTVFQLGGDGVLTTLRSFRRRPLQGPDGWGPTSILMGNDGTLYGTTVRGGTNNDGTIFRLDLEGVLTTLHSFDGADGSTPYVLLEGRDGNLYGTTEGGGLNDKGTIFQIDREGVLTTLHSFDGADGSSPVTLIERSDGNLYGTTGRGGQADAGILFRVRLTAPAFRRGDCNDDGTVNVSDATCALDWFFAGAAVPGCLAALNVNGDEKVNIADPVYLLNFLFGGGPTISAPFPDCGSIELKADATLGCVSGCP